MRMASKFAVAGNHSDDDCFAADRYSQSIDRLCVA